MSTVTLGTSIEARLVLIVCCWLASGAAVAFSPAGAPVDTTSAQVRVPAVAATRSSTRVFSSTISSISFALWSIIACWFFLISLVSRSRFWIVSFCCWMILVNARSPAVVFVLLGGVPCASLQWC
ncbi:hypothetical protein COCSADRAFT_303566 [Bipolaris sorokiniana ND90Pr]|uniref:Secreted peptide n=1 Tax=Cochliobolus sativus (strain ND90Pr / ATCC 201652) TaxID=665912 RepID=M2SN13_COCSN|nr:uncharacterized protein COCSADRAFT_303566 [Bipolaris sorokiniana ND90Pr]EMD58162.1 hypothetical protein COCSADRAFT_303566 [Bipolaris sorokiniana ND90Pr]